MNKLVTPLLFAAFTLCASAFPAAPTGDYVEIEINNPCDRSMSYGYNSHNLKPDVIVDNNGSVYPGKSVKVSVPKGAYMKFARKNQFCNTPMGRADYKGQVFTMDCK